MYTTPNMNLIGITVGQDTGLTIENNLNTNTNTLDSHNHSPGSGVQITPAGISISSDLPFGSNNATLVRSVRFSPQPAPLSGASDIGCLYESGVDLYYNDGAGNQIKLTSGGAVNATSSGISSGTATASFISSVLVVNAASNTPANIQGASILLGNNVANSKYITLSPPNALATNYSLVLPSIPASTQFVTLDASGNLATATSIQPNQIATGSINPTQLAPAIIGIASADSGAASTTSHTYVAVPNQSVTITNSGRPVLISFIGTTSTAGIVSGPGSFQLMRGATLVGYSAVGSFITPAGALTFLDLTPSAGSNTYTLFYATPSGTITADFIKMLVTEL